MSLDTCCNITPIFTRRDALRLMGCGFGWLAFNGVARSAFGSTAPATSPFAAAAPLATRPPMFAAKAKRVIFLCMRGGPSHVDTFDYKPKLNADSGKPGKRPGTTLLGSPWKFSQHGKSGLYISELFPSLATHADDLCIVRSMQTDLPAHPQAFLTMHTGTAQFVRPSMGAWTLYGLGTMNQNLPGFVSITPPAGNGGAQNYGAAFLPAIYQGTRVGVDNRSIKGAEMANLKPKESTRQQRAELDLAQAINKTQLEHQPNDPNIEGAIESLELAFKMQTEAPAVMNLDRESVATKELYGIGVAPTDDFGRKCLLARQLVEAGVRFVEVTHGNWDHHFNLNQKLEQSATEIDKPIAGLLTDLGRRGLLKDTLVVWTGEFGRTPHSQGNDGRDHNNQAFSLWMAGGGAKGGLAYGDSGDYGYEAVDGKVSIHDLHATMLHMLGLDHEKLTYNYAGRNFRLTNVSGEVIKEMIA